MRKSVSGFTVIELLVVVMVIGILAAITLVVFNGTQQRARDTQRKVDIAAIAKALHLYYFDNRTYAGINSGCGASGQGSGGIEIDYDGAGPTKSIEQCLIDGNYLAKQTRDPQASKGCTGTAPNQSCAQYIKSECGGTAGTYLFANLETIPHTSTDTDATCQAAFDTTYGMNYYVKLY
jgi:prepilin-type N-terminal cleavage/methylation domain-containing protein